MELALVSAGTALLTALVVVVGTDVVGRRQFQRTMRLRIAQETIPGLLAALREEEWTADRIIEYLSPLISSGWTVGIKDHLLILAVRDEAEGLDEEERDVRQIASVVGSIKVLQKRIHEELMGRRLTYIRALRKIS